MDLEGNCWTDKVMLEMPRYRLRNDLLNENRVEVAQSHNLKAAARKAKKE